MLVIVCLAHGYGYAQSQSYGTLQAAYLYNFAKYIKWPHETPVFVIGIMSKDSETVKIFENALAEKKVIGKDILVKKITALSESGECNIVFIPEQEAKNITPLIEEIKGKSILLVTGDDLIKKGAMISFVIEDENLRFKLKSQLLNDAGLIPSEGLLKLAIVQ